MMPGTTKATNADRAKTRCCDGPKQNRLPTLPPKPATKPLMVMVILSNTLPVMAVARPKSRMMMEVIGNITIGCIMPVPMCSTDTHMKLHATPSAMAIMPKTAQTCPMVLVTNVSGRCSSRFDMR